MGLVSSQWRRGTTDLYPERRKYVEPIRHEEKERREEVEEREPMGGDHERPRAERSQAEEVQ